MSNVGFDRAGIRRHARPLRGRAHGAPTLVTGKETPVAVAEHGEGRPIEGLSSRALALVLVASFMVVLDFSIVNVALPTIHHVLHFSGDSVQWVVTAYAISFSGLLILGGRLADLFGRRRMFISGLLLFAAASLAAGRSTDAAMLIGSRAVQGVGAALVAPASLALITSNIGEGAARSRALGLYGATASIGFVAGQVLGGVFVEFMGWASIFLVNVPVGVIAAILATRFFVDDRERGRFVHLDLAGAALVTLAVAALVYAVSEGTVLGWAHPLVIGALLLVVFSLVSFVVVERTHRHPLVDLHLLGRRNLVTSGYLSLLMGAWSAGELVVLSLYLQQTLHDSPLVSGLVIAPQGVVGFVTGMFGARTVRRIGLRRLLVASSLSAGVGFLLMSALPSQGHYGIALLAVLPIGFGTVGTVVGSTILASTSMANSDQGLVGGVINTTRQIGAALGVAVLVALAEGSHATSGTTTVAGDRLAMWVTSAIAFSGALAVLFALRRAAASPISARTAAPVVNTRNA
ncbi:MAG TPA: MFS transporter [Acidimicrobiales bacterium]